MFSKRTDDAPAPLPPTPTKAIPAVEPGLSVVRYRAGAEAKRRPVLRAVVVKADGDVCSLKVLGAEGGTTVVEDVKYSTDETNREPRWF